MATQQIAVKTVGGIGKTFAFAKNFLFFGLLFITFLIIFSNAIVLSINQKSIDPLLNELGSRFFFASQSLEEASQAIIDQGGVYDSSGAWYSKIWSVISNSAELLFAILVVFTWIRVLAWIVKKSPLSNESNWFINYSLGLIAFIVIAGIATVVRAAVAGDITSYTHAIYLLSLPVKSFITFFKALPYILSPIANILGKRHSAVNINETIVNAINGS